MCRGQHGNTGPHRGRMDYSHCLVSARYTTSKQMYLGLLLFDSALQFAAL